MDLQNKKVLVVGLGKSGVSAAMFLHQIGAKVTATDIQPANKLIGAMQALRGLPIHLCLGEHPMHLFAEADLIVLSPGVPLALEPLKRAMNRGIAVVAEVELASWFLQDTIIGITGSNGKTTTTALTAYLLARSGRNAEACGNIGKPLIDMIPTTSSERILVVELSSFQLETIDRFHPHIATVLNVTPDHMDRYSDLESYKQAKLNIFKNQINEDFLVINADEENADEILHAGSGTPFYFSSEKTVEKGAYLEKGWLVWREGKKKTKLLPASEINLPGPHNLSNSMAAAAMALIMGGSSESVADGLKEFQPLEHRLEPVTEIDGVQYINDSKATNVESAAVAIRSFDQPLIVILGGLDKGSDFTGLNPLLKEKARLVLLIGSAAEKIEHSLDEKIPSQICPSLENAVTTAHREAARGDIVLLAPACASFDMFDNYEHRGREFKRLVWRLENE